MHLSPIYPSSFLDSIMHPEFPHKHFDTHRKNAEVHDGIQLLQKHFHHSDDSAQNNELPKQGKHEPFLDCEIYWRQGIETERRQIAC